MMMKNYNNKNNKKWNSYQLKFDHNKMHGPNSKWMRNITPHIDSFDQKPNDWKCANCDPIWQNPLSDTSAEAPFAFTIVVRLRFQSREKDLWQKCPMVGFVRSGHNLDFGHLRESFDESVYLIVSKL